MGQHPTNMIAKISSGSAVEGRYEEVLLEVALKNIPEKFVLGVALGQHLKFRVTRF